MATTKLTTADKIERCTVYDPESGCRIWCGADSGNGYGRVRVDGVTSSVHRVAWESERGPIPQGMQIDHICRNRRCCRVEHLRVVPQRANVLENSNGPSAINAAKQRCPTCGGDYTERSYGGRFCAPCNRTQQRSRYAADPEYRRAKLERNQLHRATAEKGKKK